MDEAVFHVVCQGDQWRLQAIDYATKEAAFEAAVFAAQQALREAVAVHILVDAAPDVPKGGDQA